jgi:hypothetical protein
MATIININPDKIFVNRNAFCEERKNLTLSRNKIMNMFPINGTENEVAEIMVRSNSPILLKTKNPGIKVR